LKKLHWKAASADKPLLSMQSASYKMMGLFGCLRLISAKIIKFTILSGCQSTSFFMIQNYFKNSQSENAKMLYTQNVFTCVLCTLEVGKSDILVNFFYQGENNLI